MTEKEFYTYLVVGGVVLVFVLFYLAKSNARCPKCSADWALKELNSFREPRSTFQENVKNGDSLIVTTYEVGTLHAEMKCKKCNHQFKKQSNYKRKISDYRR